MAAAGWAGPFVVFVRCGSHMQRIAAILQPKVIRDILDCLRAKGRPP